MADRIVCEKSTTRELIEVYTFPSDKKRRKQWENACGRTELPKDPRLCSRHFSPDDFEAFSGLELLKELNGCCWLLKVNHRTHHWLWRKLTVHPFNPFNPLMAAARRRKPPIRDAIEHAAKGLDKTAELEEKYINSFKGRGVFAKANFQKGDFVVEYRGELIHFEESQRRRRIYHSHCAVFMFDFFWRESVWCIDAAQEDGSLGRLVNDDHCSPNCKMKKVDTEGKPHLFLFALRDIIPGEEITYDYGGTDWPWRKQVEGQPLANDSSETEMSRTTEQIPQGSPCSQMQVEGQPLANDSSETEMSRTTEQIPQGSPCSQMQVEGQPLVNDSSETEMSRTTEQIPQGSPCSQMQVEGQPLVNDSSETEMSRTTEQIPQGSPCSQMQVEGQPLANDSSETEMSRTTEQIPQGSPCSQMQVEGQPLANDSSETEMSRTTEQIPQGSPCSQMQVEGQPLANDSSETEMSRTTEQIPQGSPCSQMQVEGQPLVNDSSETEMSRTTEQIPQGSPCSQMQGSDYPEPQTLKKNFQTPISLVNYTDSDESQTSHPSFEPQCSLPEQDEYSAPRLRRTKSIQMNNQIHFDSDELYSPSDDSGEEYIPETSTDHSDDTDTSEVMELSDHKLSTPRCLNLKKIDDIEDKCLEDPTPVLERNVPDSASSLHVEDGLFDGSLNIPAVRKKQNGSRMYNKKQYCLYCKLGVGKMARHLERAHHDKPEVAQALSFPKGSKERRLHLEHLRNRGNFAHNVDVLNVGVGSLVPRKQPKQDSEAQDYLHCIYCQGFFTKKILWRHMMICKFKPGGPQKPGKRRVQALCAFALPAPPGVKEEFWKLLNNMVQDEVYSAVKSDVCIMEFGEHLYNRLGYDVGKHEYIRQKLRELGRLLVCSRKTTPLKTIEDHIRPVNFMHVVQAVKRVAGHDSETDTYKCPSLALKIGHSLTKISQLVESRANIQNNYPVAKDARTFRRVYETRWNEQISAASLRTLQESKWNAPRLLPFTKDVQTLHSYLDVQQQLSHSKLSTETSPQTWTQLAKITLTQVILFNRRRAGEVSKMPLSAYLSQNASDPQEDVNVALSDLEKKLCQHFRRIEIRGKRGRKVPVLLTPAMQESLDLLVSKRQKCGVPQDNIYLFARPSAFTCYRGSDCLRQFAKICGAKSPESLTSTKLRKQTGTLSQVLNLSNTELDQLADFLGHDIRVHRQFYRLPEGTLQLAKISKVLMALEQGRLSEFKGKTLDDISIDPEENVHPDSDTDVVCESDSQESQVSFNEGEENETTIPDVSHVDAAPKQDTMTPPQARWSRSPKKDRGRRPLKRRMWDKEEIRAVETHMMSFITSCRVPGKSDFHEVCWSVGSLCRSLMECFCEPLYVPL
ncbi:hypothetical protein ABVT39_000841 [Epinephelus coioides]